MKFMLLYKIHQEKRHDALKGFAQMSPEDDKSDMGRKIKLMAGGMMWHTQKV